MRILLIHRWFWPDAPPYASMLRSIGRRLVEDGHQVTVLTAQPSYHRASKVQRRRRMEVLDGMTVRRVRLLPESKRNYAARGLNMLLFMHAVRRVILKARGAQAFHAVMASTMPPVLVAASARRAARRRDAAFLYHMMDLYPEIALISGMAKPGLLTRWLARVDFRNCAMAERVIVLSSDMRKSLAARGLDTGNVVEINNFRLEGFDGEISPPPPGLEKPEGAFRLLFAGNLGRFQGLEQVIEAMHLIGDELSDLRLDFLGDGHGRAALERQAGAMLDRRIFFHGFVPAGQAAQVVRGADLSLVTLNADIIRYAYPSKTMTCLAEGSPLLVMVEEDSELARMVRHERIGFVVPQNDPAAMADALRRAYAAREELEPMRTRSRALALRSFTAERLLQRWSELYGGIRDNLGNSRHHA